MIASVSYSGERFGPTCWPPTRSPASMSTATRTWTAREDRTESTRSRWATSSTIRVIALAAAGEATSWRSRLAVDGRVGDDEVVADRLLVQPQRLAQGERQHAVEAVAGQRPAQQVRHPHRLGGDPDRLAGGPADQVVGVGVECVEVDDHQRRAAVGSRVRRQPGSTATRVRRGPGRGAPSGDAALAQESLDVGHVVVDRRSALAGRLRERLLLGLALGGGCGARACHPGRAHAWRWRRRTGAPRCRPARCRPRRSG